MNPARGKRLSLVLVIGLAALGLAALGASYISFARVYRFTIGSSADDEVLRGADTLAAAFDQIMMRLRYCSAALLLGAVLATVYRRKVQVWIEEALLPLPRFLSDVAGSLVTGLRNDGRLNAAVLLALVLLGVALRTIFLFRAIRFDEADSFISYASRPLYVGLSYYNEPNNHLFQTLLMHFSWLSFGDDEWAIRMPALIFGTLLIPVTYWAARMFYDKDSALIAAALVACASPLVGYSVDGRGYVILCVLFMLLMITSRYLLDHDSPPAWLLWAVIASLGFYTIPTMLYGVITAALWMAVSFWGTEPKRLRRAYVQLASGLFLTGLFTCLLYLPVVLASGWEPLVSNRFVKSRTFTYVFETIQQNVWETWEMWTADVPLPVALILAVGFGIGLIIHRSNTGFFAPPLVAFLCIPLLLVAQRVVPFARVWMFLLPLCAMVSATGLMRVIRYLGDRGRFSAIVALALFVLIGQSVSRSPTLAADFTEGVESSVVWMHGYLKPSDVVLAWRSTLAPLKYHFRRYRTPVVGRPAPPCSVIVEAFTSKGTQPGKTGEGTTRVLIVTTTAASGTAETIAACAKASPSPRLVYENAGISVFESIPAL